MNVPEVTLVFLLFLGVGLFAHWLCRYAFSNKVIGWSSPLLLEARKAQENNST
jgi:hypothetical protein